MHGERRLIIIFIYSYVLVFIHNNSTNLDGNDTKIEDDIFWLSLTLI